MSPRQVANWARQAAAWVAAWSLGLVFVLFVYGVAMRYLFNRPQGWVDEAVIILSVWSTFWTAALVLRWPENIAFDVLFANLGPAAQRAALLFGCTAFVVLMGAALPGLVDYTLFLWRERSDTLQLRLDVVYAVFPAFIIVIVLRLCFTIAALVGPGWQDELSRWSAGAPEDKS
ncbi:MAG: TRAP transporter small permease subunit [Burkholderiales bacterium]|jgi:TRAP-type C4-dicarboxylate transport system permease small subunit|nr:TRAP transporter small permease subunit [Burkholderiales bacterium]